MIPFELTSWLSDILRRCLACKVQMSIDFYAETLDFDSAIRRFESSRPSQ